MKKKSKSSVLFVLIVAVIGFLAFAGFKGFILGGYEFKSFDKVITKGLDLQGGVSVLMEIQQDNVTREQLENTKQHLELRVNSLGVAETVVTTEGDKSIRVDIPGYSDSNGLVESLGKSGNLVFKGPDGEEILTGKDIKNATAQLNQNNGGSEVGLELNAEGQKKFAEATKKYIGQAISIYMDDELLISPTVQTQITDGRASITGTKTLEENKKLAGIINSGALPVTVKAVSVKNVGAQLGQEALPNAMKAAVVGVGLIFVLMIAIYRVQGIIADIALTLYILLILFIFAEIGVTLTLPGIAALLLTIGMAVDANILIYERTKDELRKGLSVRSAVKAGSEHALSSIVDSNVTTILSALILYFIGSGSVKGFAITLMIGILVSLFTALVVTKVLTNLAVEMGILKKLSHFGVSQKEKKRVVFDIIGKSKIWICMSAIIIVIGLGTMCFKGLNYGLDFLGGTEVTIQVNDNANKEELDSIVKSYAKDAVTSISDKNEYEIKSKDLDSSKVSKIMNDLKEKYNLEDSALVSQDEIGASIGKELTRSSVLAVLAAFLMILIYVGIRFEFKFGSAAVIAVIHDVLLTISFYAIFRVPVNTPFIAAILTVIGYSINDTIVIFDRIREDSRKMRRAVPTEIANKGINDTLKRSIYTSASTLITITAVNIFVPTVREFSTPLIVGIAAGAYSSIFIASPIWVLLKEKFNKSPKKKLQGI